VRWSWCRFGDLGAQALYEILALRCRVFVLEQGPYLDPDGLDQCSWHLQGRDAQGVLQAYLRAVDPGAKFAEPSIGRVLTAPEVRGTGLGRRLMQQGLRHCASQWPAQAVRISAQSRLRAFYQSLGFEAVGDDYLEDGISHIEMLHRAPVARGAGPVAEESQ
jgi:ElaA protein